MADLNRALAMRILWSYHGTPYVWGGSGPSGIDCSGLVIEVLASVGKFPRNQDTTADGLFKYYHMQEISYPELEIGCLVFWLDRNTNKATHVGMIVQIEDNEAYYMAAEGGGSKTLTPADAVKHDAYVKVFPLSSRGGIKAFSNPWKQGRGDV